MLPLDPLGKVDELDVLDGAVDCEEDLQRDGTRCVLPEPEPDVDVDALLPL